MVTICQYSDFNPKHKNRRFPMTKYNFFRSLLVALLIPLTFACTGMNIFSSNSTEWGGNLPVVMPLLFGFVIVTALGLFLVQLPFLFIKKDWFIPVNSFLFVCGFLLWLQANVFNWNFGELDGSGVNWQAFRTLMVLEIVVYAAIIGLVLWKRQWFNKYIIHFACLLMLVQVILQVNGLYMSWRHSGTWQQYEATYDGFFDYSEEQNVLLIIPDAFSSQLFQRMIKKHPEMLEWFSDFNYFTKQKSQDSTSTSIPQIFTACNAGAHRTTRAASLWNSEGTLLKTLTEAGFQTRIYTWAQTRYHWDHQWVSNIRLKGSVQDSGYQRTRWDDWAEAEVGLFADLAVVRSVPIVFKPADFESFRWIQQFFPVPAESETSTYRTLQKLSDPDLVRIIRKNPASAKSVKPVFNVIHYKGAHFPYDFNEQFEKEVMRSIEGEERQAFASILLIKRLLDGMKTAGVYDNTHIIIAGDHGCMYPQRMTCVGDRMQFHNPLLLVKRQNERHENIVYRSEYTNVQDMTPTILDLVGIENLPGRFSIFNIPPDILAQRETEYETFWAEKHEKGTWASKYQRQMPVVNMNKMEGGYRVTSDIALKRSELCLYHGQLCWYAGDNPDIWNNTYSHHEALILMTPASETSARYQGSVHLTMVGSEREPYHYWYCTGIIDTASIADGEYEVAFLLPRKEGTYAKNILGKVTVTLGMVNVHSIHDD